MTLDFRASLNFLSNAKLNYAVRRYLNMSHKNYKILILGASYGSLLASKLLLAGHRVTLVCTAPTAKIINREGTVVRIPVKGRSELVILDSCDIAQYAPSSNLDARVPEDVEPDGYDLVVLGMQEPQYSASGVRELLKRIAHAKVPAVAIMNMPPLPFLKRFPQLQVEQLMECYREPALWEDFEPGLVTLASPDPQAFRPDNAQKNELQVSLPTNFKVARFEMPEHTEMLKRIQTGIEQVRWYLPNRDEVELPVKVKVFDSLYVPLAKWSMLMTGNYRCIEESSVRSIKDAVHSNLEESNAIYNWTVSLCVAMGADKKDMVPFDKYANAALGLAKPSSVARALSSGAVNIERVDKLIRNVARQFDVKSESVDLLVQRVDEGLDFNRQEQASESDLNSLNQQNVVGSN